MPLLADYLDEALSELGHSCGETGVGLAGETSAAKRNEVERSAYGLCSGGGSPPMAPSELSFWCQERHPI